MKTFLLVGLGRVGLRTLRYLRELFPSSTFLAVEIDKAKLEALKVVEGVEPHRYEPGILGKLGERADLAVTALPSSVAFRTILELASYCVSTVDASFFVEDPFVLDKLLDDCRSTLLVDAGFAPGYSNIVAGYAYYGLGLSGDIEIDVGGIPESPIPPIGYTVTWNARDLLEEYIRPARYVDNFEVKNCKPIECVYELRIEGLGSFEGFVSDGLRTMLKNIKARSMRELTIRWPGHLNSIRLLYELGLLDAREVEVSGIKIRPIDLTARMFEERLSISSNDMAILQVKAVNSDGRYYRELAILRGTPEDPAVPVFTALIHAYTTKLLAERKLKTGIVAPENLYEFKEEYERYLADHGVAIRKEVGTTQP